MQAGVGQVGEFGAGEERGIFVPLLCCCCCWGGWDTEGFGVGKGAEVGPCLWCWGTCQGEDLAGSVSVL